MEVLIIGNGIAGNEVASCLQSLGGDCSLTCLAAEPYPEYDPCSLTYFVGGDVPRDKMFRQRGSAPMRVIRERATAIDARRHTVSTDQGHAHAYDKLVLAHGGSLLVPPIPGVELGGVFGCKQLHDAEALAAHPGSAAVVIGSGAIGIEAAEALKKRGYSVVVIELLEWILPTMFDEPPSRMLEQQLAACGIKVLSGEKVVRIEGQGRVAKVVTDHREIACDTVVLATGVIPGRDLAVTAGIEVGRGIKVDRQQRTSVPDIFACGDCAETADLLTGRPCLYQLKHNAIEQARVAARSILGLASAYPGAYPFARLHFFDTHAVTFGQTERGLRGQAGVEIQERHTRNSYLRLVLKQGQLFGAQAVGAVADQAGLLLGSMLRKDDFHQLRAAWPQIAQLDSPWPWRYRALGRLCGWNLQ